MKVFYLSPSAKVVPVCSEGLICLSGGRSGGEGKPGADFDPDLGDINDYGDF